ncbi:hypothetical protein ACWDYB_36355, partial [Streptomyces sp. NPDC003299]
IDKSDTKLSGRSATIPVSVQPFARSTRGHACRLGRHGWARAAPRTAGPRNPGGHRNPGRHAPQGTAPTAYTAPQGTAPRGPSRPGS